MFSKGVEVSKDGKRAFCNTDMALAVYEDSLDSNCKYEFEFKIINGLDISLGIYEKWLFVDEINGKLFNLVGKVSLKDGSVSTNDKVQRYALID